MPLYEYLCPKCDKITELFVSIKEAEEKIPCDVCGETAYRIISPSTFLLKGNPRGWDKPAAKDPSPKVSSVKEGTT
jgi:putative FmdB family regulatory protein